MVEAISPKLRMSDVGHQTPEILSLLGAPCLAAGRKRCGNLRSKHLLNKTILLITLIYLVVFAILPTLAKADSAPIITRDSIIRYAASGVGSPYVWGGDKWIRITVNGEAPIARA